MEPDHRDRHPGRCRRRHLHRIGVRIYLSVGPGGEPASDFAITSFEALQNDEGSPTVAATVRNTGGRAVDLSGELRLTNGPGGLSAGPFEARLGTTLGVGQTEPVLVVLDRAIPAVPWEARILLRSGLTERDARATITFPAASTSPAAPVPVADDPSGRGWMLPVGVGGAVLVGVPTTLLLLHRRRRPTVF